MKNILLIGKGEIGSSINKIEIEAGNSASIIEKNYTLDLRDGYDVCHVCIPYKNIDSFSFAVLSSIKNTPVGVVIIHSTVELGTTRYIFSQYQKPIVHSFCRGVHPNLYEGIKTFEKPVGGINQISNDLVSEHYDSLGIPYKVLSSPENSEMGKLLDTTYYGYNILFAKYVNEYCREYGLDYDEVYTWANETYNKGYLKLGKPNVVRPVLFPPDGEIGGHCVVPNFKLLPDSKLKDFCTS